MSRPHRRPPTRAGGPAAVLAAWLLTGCAGATGGAAGSLAAPLFQEEDPARLVLRADFDAIREERFQDRDPSFRPGTLRYTGPGGEERSLDVRVRRRGNSRRYICDFPPLLLELPDSGGRDPVFGGHDRLHHVSHCRDGRPESDDLAVKEYLAYRIYALLVPERLETRLVRARYENTGDKGGEEAAGGDSWRWAFVVEDRGRLSRREGGVWVDDADRVDPSRIDGDRAALVSVFQYLIGNSDWSIPSAHNVMLLEEDGGTLLPVPYDFDFSGLVNAPYARPDPRWGLDSVRERIFLGCRTEEHLPEALDRLREAAPAIEEAARSVDGLPREVRSDVREYVGDVLDQLRDDGLEAELRADCRE